MLTPLYSDATERKDEYGLIVTFGLAFFLRNMAIIIFGPFPLKPPSFVPGVLRIGELDRDERPHVRGRRRDRPDLALL